MRNAVLLLLLCLPGRAAFSEEGTQQLAPLGDFKLESGEVLRDCSIGYRTYGHLNADSSNVIVFPTWFTGTSKELEDYFGPGKLVDTSTYYVVAVDALANGISTSPSNSRVQPRMTFPRIGVRDMVTSQHQLLTQVLHVTHLKAVIGDSMGGMQTFQWIVSYPDFMDKAVPIVGSPRLGAYNLTLWQAEIDAIQNDPAWRNGDYSRQPGVTTIAELEALTLTTAAKYDREIGRERFRDALDDAKKGVATFDANDRIRQLEAMMAHDVSAPFGGSLERAAAAVRARILVIVDAYDHMVTPFAALDFARLLRAQVLEVQSDCGHQGPECDMKNVGPVVAAFLAS